MFHLLKNDMGIAVGFIHITWPYNKFRDQRRNKYIQFQKNYCRLQMQVHTAFISNEWYIHSQVSVWL